MAHRLHFRIQLFVMPMLKINKGTEEAGCVVFQLSGPIRSEGAVDLLRLIRAENQSVALDLKEVRLVDRATVKFLAQCQAADIELRNPSAYIREWISQEASAIRRTNAFGME
jgi:hypothetical protein